MGMVQQADIAFSLDLQKRSDVGMYEAAFELRTVSQPDCWVEVKECLLISSVTGPSWVLATKRLFGY